MPVTATSGDFAAGDTSVGLGPCGVKGGIDVPKRRYFIFHSVLSSFDTNVSRQSRVAIIPLALVMQAKKHQRARKKKCSACPATPDWVGIKKCSIEVSAVQWVIGRTILSIVTLPLKGGPCSVRTKKAGERGVLSGLSAPICGASGGCTNALPLKEILQQVYAR